MRTLKIVGTLFGLVLVGGQWSCNTAADGFNAEVGSAISLPGDESLTTNTDTLFLVTASVTNAAGEPKNETQIQFFCNQCFLYDRAEGQNVTSPDLSRLQAVSNPYFVTSSSLGTYQLVVYLPAPATVGVDSYDATLYADIGVGGAKTKFTVTAQ